MSYEPRQFWEQRLREHFDLRGTGETGLSLAYNRACYALRREVLERALREAHVALAGAVSVGGVLLYTDVFSPSPSQLAHNRTRPLVRHLDILRSSGLQVLGMYPTHVLLNHDLGRFRFLNAVPALLLGVDRLLLAAGVRGRLRNQLLVARRSA